MKSSTMFRPLPCTSLIQTSSHLHNFHSFKLPYMTKNTPMPISIHSTVGDSSRIIGRLSLVGIKAKYDDCGVVIASTSSTISTKTPHQPKTPLFLRPPIYSTTSNELNTFITWAKTLISSVGSTFVDLDPAVLHRDLDWFLNDAVYKSPSDEAITLRESLENMYRLWEARVEKRRPIQYIVGCEKWREFRISVEDGILIPRPETAEMVDIVEDVVKEKFGDGGSVWADLGTGSGALSIGIARVLGGLSKNSDVRVVATDISPIATAVANYNVQRYHLQDIIEIRQGSWFEPIMELEGKLDGLVSNPPYVPSEEISYMRPEASKHEPKLAMDGGQQGLDFLSFICTKTSSMLKPGGFFIFETHGEKQCKSLANNLENIMGDSICNVNIVLDFASIPRFVTGYRKDVK